MLFATPASMRSVTVTKTLSRPMRRTCDELEPGDARGAGERAGGGDRRGEPAGVRRAGLS